jgi:hypothetical protein
VSGQSVSQSQTAPRAPQTADSGAQAKSAGQFTGVADAAIPAVAAPMRTAQAAAPKKAVPLAGYTSVDEESAASVTRRRYVSSAGTPLILVIVQSAAAQKAGVRSEAAPEFVVRTANGTSAVRWTSGGLSYELSGALSADSLVKLATLLR